jgi:hypothetical protein
MKLVISAYSQANEKGSSVRFMIGPSASTRAANKVMEEQFKLAREQEAARELKRIREEAEAWCYSDRCQEAEAVGGASEASKRLW